MGKDRATAVFRCLVSGEVLGEIVAESGEVAVFKNFGVVSEGEYRKILKLIEQENPDIAYFLFYVIPSLAPGKDKVYTHRDLQDIVTPSVTVAHRETMTQ